MCISPDGKPEASAILYTIGSVPYPEQPEPVLRARATADGTFRFTLTRSEFDDAIGRGPWSTVTVLAAAEGLGPDWVELRKPPDESLTLRLVDDSVPIKGRILDLQGRPVSGEGHARPDHGGGL